jgi:hypothetical protein
LGPRIPICTPDPNGSGHDGDRLDFEQIVPADESRNPDGGARRRLCNPAEILASNLRYASMFFEMSTTKLVSLTTSL